MNKQSGFTLMELLIAIVSLGIVGLFFVAVYALVHFVSKFW